MRGSRIERGYDAAWTKLRNNYIKHNPLCECRGPACKVAARIVHHINPVHLRPDLRLERSNLMSVCDPCHQMLHAEKVPGVVVAVCGAPASGKTTYVERNKKQQDMVFDWDHIRTALGMNPNSNKAEQWLLMDIRSMIVNRITSGVIPRTLWLIVSSFASAVKLGDQYVCMSRTRQQCINEIEARHQRLEDRPRRAAIRKAVDTWFRLYGDRAGTEGFCEDVRGIINPPLDTAAGGTHETTARKSRFPLPEDKTHGTPASDERAALLRRIGEQNPTSW